MKRFLLTAIGALLLGLAYYLHLMDHSTVISAPGMFGNGFSLGLKVIGPPWYANLWPETLAVGILLLASAIFLLIKKGPI